MYNLVGDTMIKVDNYTYELVENYKDGFDEVAFKDKYTDYFYDYDYILGDYAYNKLRLKGFCEKNNKRFNKINDIKNKDNYLTKECAYKCKYFLLKIVKKS